MRIISDDLFDSGDGSRGKLPQADVDTSES